MDTQPMYRPKEFISLLEKRAVENDKNKATEKKELTFSFKYKNDPAKSKATALNLFGKLRGLEKISEEEFKQLFNYKAQESEEFFKVIGAHLPLMENDLLIYLMDFISLEVKKHWAFRARCVAEAYKRCPKLLGGRNKKAKDGEGRRQLTALLADRFGTSKTNIRLDEKIMRTFSTHHEETVPDSDSVSSEDELNEFTITRSANNEFFTDLALPSKTKKNVIDTYTFQPHPDLTRQHYVVACRLNTAYARLAINEAITEIAAGNIYTPAKMESRLFPVKKTRPGNFKLEQAQNPSSVTKLEVSLDELDAQVLYSALAKNLKVNVTELEKTSFGERVLREQGFSCFMNILEEYLKIKESPQVVFWNS